MVRPCMAACMAYGLDCMAHSCIYVALLGSAHLTRDWYPQFCSALYVSLRYPPATHTLHTCVVRPQQGPKATSTSAAPSPPTWTAGCSLSSCSGSLLWRRAARMPPKTSLPPLPRLICNLNFQRHPWGRGSLQLGPLGVPQSLAALAMCQRRRSHQRTPPWYGSRSNPQRL